MSTRDYYEVLGVDRTASADEIKRAYRRLAKKYHPDRNADDPAAEGKFKEVQGAHDVLKDSQKRAQYDRFGPAAAGDWRTGPAGEQVYSWSSDGPQINIDDLEDLFSAFGGSGAAPGSAFGDLFGQQSGFGGQRGRARRAAPPARGQDVQRKVNLAFEVALRGTSIEIDVGARNGSGHAQTLTVKIPAGVDDGQRIRVKGRGYPGSNGGPPGNLYLIVSVRPHPHWRRQGRDLFIDLPLTLTQASLGAKVDLATPDGTVTITVPPGTDGGSKLRLAGQGIAKRGGSRGDLYAVTRIAVLAKPTARQRELLEELAATLDHNADPDGDHQGGSEST
ncbi:MAG: DnaJ domain-containing protein [Planctomycetes bacterium]|nr:DnaJ domain-containing protein [Planctomycetota bacterium]